MNFKNQNALITGASHGLGFATAEMLAQKQIGGLALMDIDESSLREKAQYLKRYDVKIHTYPCDVSHEEQVNRTVQNALEAFGSFQILINSAGIYRGDALFAQSDSKVWKQKIAVNILGTMYVTRALINSMIDNRYGRIINFGSVTGIYGKARAVDYSMTKGAIDSFTKALAKEVAEYGITVNTVSPGSVVVLPEDDRPGYTFVGRCGRPEEVANLIFFLVSSDAGYICGQNYQIDGLRKQM